MTQSHSPSTIRRDARAAARAARAAAREASLLHLLALDDDPDAEDDDDELSIEHIHANNPFGFPPGGGSPPAAPAAA